MAPEKDRELSQDGIVRLEDLSSDKIKIRQPSKASGKINKIHLPLKQQIGKPQPEKERGHN